MDSFATGVHEYRCTDLPVSTHVRCHTASDSAVDKFRLDLDANELLSWLHRKFVDRPAESALV